MKQKLRRLKRKIKFWSVIIGFSALLLFALADKIINKSPLALFQRTEDSDNETGSEYTYEEVQSALSEMYASFKGEISAYENVEHTDIHYENTTSNAADVMVAYALLAPEEDSDEEDEMDPCILTDSHKKVLEDVFNAMNSYSVSKEKVVVVADGDKIGSYAVTRHECDGSDNPGTTYKESTYGTCLVKGEYLDVMPIGSIIKIKNMKFRVIGQSSGSFPITICVPKSEIKGDEDDLKPPSLIGPNARVSLTRGASTVVEDGGGGSKGNDNSEEKEDEDDEDSIDKKYPFDGTSCDVVFCTSEAVPDVSYEKTDVYVSNLTFKSYLSTVSLTSEQQDYYEMMKEDDDVKSVLSSLGFELDGSGFDSLIVISTPVTGDKANFIEVMGAYAVQYYETTGILPSIMVAQACFESAYGTSFKARSYNNYYGLTWSSSGRMSKYNHYTSPNGWTWCTFDSLPQGVEGYYTFMEGKYYDALHWNTDVENCAKILNEHYCPDAGYPEHILSVIYSNNLTRFDDEVLNR